MQAAWICPITADIHVHMPFLGSMCCSFHLWPKHNKHDNAAVSHSTRETLKKSAESLHFNEDLPWNVPF